MENVLIAITRPHLWYVHCENDSDTNFHAIWFSLFFFFTFKGLEIEMENICFKEINCSLKCHHNNLESQSFSYFKTLKFNFLNHYTYCSNFEKNEDHIFILS